MSSHILPKVEVRLIFTHHQIQDRSNLCNQMHPNGETSYDRIVATCFLPDGTDLGGEMIRLGMALDLPKFSGGKYQHLETDEARRTLKRRPY